MTDPRKGMIAWAAVIVPTWIVMILCTHWEPVAHDGWGHWVFHRDIGLSAGSFYDLAKYNYGHGNPRLGQMLTLLVYTPGPWHAIVTPIVELALFYLLALLALGRWPSLRRADDALLYAAILTAAVISVPMIGLMLFYRPFTGNYLFGLVIDLALLVPYRLHFEEARRGRWWWAPALLVLGFAAGLCNEHTGPALVAMCALATFWFWRRGDGLVAWAVAGLAGVLAGGIALFLAPGQGERYRGLAKQASTFGRIVERGLAGNVKIFTQWLHWLVPLLALIAIGLLVRIRDRPAPQPRTRTVAQLAMCGLGFAITATLLLSPKQGSRLYLASVVLVGAAVAGWMVAQLASRLMRALVAAACACVLLGVGYRLVSTYRTLGGEFRARMAILEAAPMHSGPEVPAYTIKRSRWSVGDDLLIENIRNLVAGYLGLALIKVDDQRDPTTPPPEEP